MKCRHVNVDVVANDSVDIRCGGPDVLGFDFYVAPTEKPDAIEKYIRECLDAQDLPCMGVSVSRPYSHDGKKLWTRRMIKMCINRDAGGMRPIGWRHS